RVLVGQHGGLQQHTGSACRKRSARTRVESRHGTAEAGRGGRRGGRLLRPRDFSVGSETLMLAASSVRVSGLIRVVLAVNFVAAVTGAAIAQGAGPPPTATCPVGRLPPTDPVGVQRVKRLLSLSEVWGTVRTLHPSLADKTVDWDAALVTAIPKVSGAR